MCSKWLFSILLLQILKTEAWSGHVCTTYSVTYRTERYCHRNGWWTGKHVCKEWKDRQKTIIDSVRHCCYGWKHNGNQLCNIRTDVMDVSTDREGNKIPTHPYKIDMFSEPLSLVKRQVSICGGNLTAQTRQMTLTSPNYPNWYGNDLSCTWTIQAPLTYRIVIRITDVNFEPSVYCYFDYLKINIGNNNSLETDRICRKNNTDLIFISRSNKADIIFITDKSMAKSGFSIQYQAVPNCGGYMTAETWTTTLKSPNYPYEYENNLYCHWIIQARGNYRIAIRITYLDLEENAECSKDYLQLYLGANPILETSRICKTENANLYFVSRSNEADVIFVTDGSTTKTGFLLQYQIQLYGGTLTALTGITTLTSPGYPYQYENNLHCNWIIQAPTNYIIVILITNIDVQQSRTCSLDYLKINIGSRNTVLETDRLCIKNNGDLIFLSRSNKADIIFVTDGSITKTGFSLQYQAVTNCGRYMMARTWTTTLNSPINPYRDSNNLYCHWTIGAGIKQRISIRITHLELDENTTCSHEYLQLYLGNNSTFETNRLCRKNSTDLNFISRSKEADVIFVTDSSVTMTGFSLQYQAVPICRGYVRAESWTTLLTSPNYPDQYENNLHCNWIIQAPANYIIVIRITVIDLEPSTDCSLDYLKIDLASSNNILRNDKICRKNKTDLIFISRSNKADVSFVTDGSTTRTGFSLLYYSVVCSCQDVYGDVGCIVNLHTPLQNGIDSVRASCGKESPPKPPDRGHNFATLIIISVVGSVLLLIIAGLCCYCYFRRKRTRRANEDRPHRPDTEQQEMRHISTQMQQSEFREEEEEVYHEITDLPCHSSNIQYSNPTLYESWINSDRYVPFISDRNNVTQENNNRNFNCHPQAQFKTSAADCNQKY